MFRVIACALLLLLSGCVNQHKLTPVQVDCQLSCDKRLSQCVKECQNNCATCGEGATQSAAKRYHQFKHRQCVQGKMVARELQSYRDPLQCRKTTCNCQADHKICLQACTGIIHKRLQVPPICC